MAKIYRQDLLDRMVACASRFSDDDIATDEFERQMMEFSKEAIMVAEARTMVDENGVHHMVWTYCDRDTEPPKKLSEVTE